MRNGWRERVGGKILRGKGCAKIRHSFEKKSVISYGEKKSVIWYACTSRPTAGQLVPVGPQQAN